MRGASRNRGGRREERAREPKRRGWQPTVVALRTVVEASAVAGERARWAWERVVRSGACGGEVASGDHCSAATGTSGAVKPLVADLAAGHGRAPRVRVVVAGGACNRCATTAGAVVASLAQRPSVLCISFARRVVPCLNRRARVFLAATCGYITVGARAAECEDTRWIAVRALRTLRARWRRVG